MKFFNFFKICILLSQSCCLASNDLPSKNESQDYYFDVKPSFTFKSNFEGETDYLLYLNLERTINDQGGTFKINGTVGTSNSLSLAANFPFWKTYYFNPSMNFNKPFSLFVEDEVISQYPTPTAGFKLGFGKNLINSNGSIEVGLEGITSLRTDTPQMSDTKDLWIYVSSQFGTLEDNCFIPKNGFKARAKYTTLKNINLYGVDSLLATDLFKYFNLIFSGYYGSTLGSPLIDEAFSLGGFLRVSNFKNNDVFGAGVGCFDALIFHKVDNSIFKEKNPFDLYIGASLEAGNYWSDNNVPVDADFNNSITLFAGIDLNFASVSLGPRFGGHDNRFGLYIKITNPSKKCFKSLEKDFCTS